MQLYVKHILAGSIDIQLPFSIQLMEEIPSCSRRRLWLYGMMRERVKCRPINWRNAMSPAVVSRANQMSLML